MSSKQDYETNSERDTVLDEKTNLKEPRLYKVLMLNDDYTPMDFVVKILIMFFNLDEETAQQKMLQIHNTGRAICGIYTKDIAETKAHLVNKYARDSSYPLLCDIEQA